MKKVLKNINKIEIFRPKRKFNAPKLHHLFVPKSQQVTFRVGGMTITVANEHDENAYVRFL